MKLAVFGLGYVGSVSAVCLAAQGHDVVGVDVNPLKTDMLNDGRAVVAEPGLDELMTKALSEGKLRATVDAEAALMDAEASLICVGTPSRPNGSFDMDALERTVATIGDALPRIGRRHTVIVRSTTLPGTSEATIIPLLEKTSLLTAGRDFGYAVNPEFLREGVSVSDFLNPSRTVVGELGSESGDVVSGLYEGLPGLTFRTSVRVAETVKYVDNAYHALKIAFANEIGAFCRAKGLDSHEVMEIFTSDSKLNISTAYLKPGFAFGGSCLPKDLRALVYSARQADLQLPLLESVLPSNERHLQRAFEAVVALGRKRVGIFGLSFKEGTDDLRESPLVELSERLIGKGFDLRIHDPAVSLSALVGSNREFIEERIPHLSALLVSSPQELMDHAEVCVIGAKTEDAVRAVSAREDRIVVDLVRVPGLGSGKEGGDGYIGIAW